MRSTPKGITLKISTVVFAVAVCVGAAIIRTWQDRAATAETPPVVGIGGSSLPVSTPALW